MTIIAYRKHITRDITRELRGPEGCIELATVDGVTYVFLPASATLGEQPAEIADSITEVTLDAVTRSAIKAASPHCRLIADRMQQRIRERYSLDDEMYFNRIGSAAALDLYQPTADELHDLSAFNAHIDDVRDWGRQQRAALGL
ncbi:MAG: hypothetical protein PHD19_11595 [Dechloromonas sp.]|nr:hypothetical protein [Dechloromonas sp.]